MKAKFGGGSFENNKTFKFTQALARQLFFLLYRYYNSYYNSFPKSNTHFFKANTNTTKKETLARCFPVNFAKFLRIPIFMEHLWSTASGFILMESLNIT